MGGLSGKRPEGVYRTSDEGLPKDERYAPLDAESVAAFAAPVWTRSGVGRFTHRILPREWKDRLTRSTLRPSSYRMVLAEAPDRWTGSRPPASVKVGCPTNRPNGEGELEGRIRLASHPRAARIE